MGELDHIDPLISRLDDQEKNIVNGILKTLLRLFPERSFGHSIDSIENSFFAFYIQGFTELEFITILRLYKPFLTSFRHFKVIPHTSNGTIGLELSFYRTKEKGKNLPLPFNSKSKIIKCENLSKSLTKTDLSAKDIKNAKMLIEQFCFSELYSSGNIHATILENENDYSIVFSNLESIHSGFLATYFEYFKDLRIKVKFSPSPFEIYVTTEKVDKIVSKKRNGEKQDGPSEKKIR